MKMWDGRFSGKPDSRVNDFNSSISFDCRMYREDIEGSVAHATMLGECGIISMDDSLLICKTLKEILADIDDGKLMFDPDAEDIHMFIESVLTERIGDVGKRLHTSRSRNDQVALDLRMYLKKEIREIQELTRKLLEVIYDKAEEYADAVMPGYTHLQRAQPLTLGHYLMAYAQMLMRDINRLDGVYEHTDVMPLGSCALAATTYPINRHRVAELLGFSKITDNSIDGVSDRDYALELASAISIQMMHLSRFSEEIILWCSSEFGFIELDDAFATGSSIMPQKKNPDIAELVRGKTGRVYGDMTALYTVMKGLPLAYNKDMQEDKENIFDAVDTVKICLDIFRPMLETVKPNRARLRNAASGGFINATDCADYLVKQGVPFRSAYKITGKLVAYCIENDKTFETLTPEEYKAASDVFDNGVYDAVNLDNCVAERNVHGGPSPESVKAQLEILNKFIEERK